MTKEVNILHIDGDNSFLELMKYFLEDFSKDKEYQYHVDILSNPNDVFNILDENKYDVIICNYKMKSLSGINILESIREKELDTIFIVLTGKGREEEVIQSINLGADYYLKKSPDFFEHQINNLYTYIRKSMIALEKHKQTKSNEEKLQTILNVASIGYVEYDRNFRITKVNSYFCSILDRKEEEILGTSTFKFIDKTEFEILRSHMEIREQGVSSTYEITFVKPNNKKSYCLIKSMPILDDNDEFIGSIELVTDVTEVKMRSVELKDSEKKHRDTLNSISYPLHVVNEDLEIVLYNKELINLTKELGLKSDVLNKEIRYVFPFVTNSDLDEYRRIFRNKMVSKSTETVMINDREITAEIKKTPLIEKNKVSHIITSIKDITEKTMIENYLKESEERFRKLAENISDGIIIIENETVVFTNDRLTKITGYSKKELEFMDIRDIILSEEIKAVNDIIESTEKNGELEKVIEFWIRRKNAEKRFIRYSFSIDNLNMNKKRKYCIITDITDKWKHEQELKKSKDMIQTVIDSLPDDIAIFWKDKEGHFLGCNKKFASDAKLRNTEEIIGKTENDLIWPQEEIKQFIKTDNAVIEHKQPVEYVTISKIFNGEDRRFKNTKLPLYDDFGNVIGILCTIKDITDLNSK